MFLLDVFRKQAKGPTIYEWFEQIVLSIRVLIICLVIVYSLIIATIKIFEDLVSLYRIHWNPCTKGCLRFDPDRHNPSGIQSLDRLGDKAKVGRYSSPYRRTHYDHCARSEVSSIGLRSCERGDASGPRRSGVSPGRSILANFRRRAAKAVTRSDRSMIGGLLPERRLL